MDPDEEIQQAIRLLFTLLERFGSALAVAKYFAAPKLRFPTRSQGHRVAVEVTWQPLALKRVLDVLHNPFYAGTYVYGRTHVGTHRLARKGTALPGW